MNTVLILGGTSDIGIAIARRFAQEGYTLLLTGRNEDYTDRVARDIHIRTGADVSPFRFDATNYASHEGFYSSLDPKPDICVCVFGYLGDQKKGEATWAEAAEIIDVNYKGAVSILNIIADDFATRRKGVIVGISSVAGDRGRQSNYLYGSAKAGFSAYLSGLRNRLYHHGVHVLTVKPGFVDTRMTEHLALPSLLTAKPDRVADKIYRVCARQQNVLYVLGRWRLIMLIIRWIPEAAFKRLKL